MKVRIGLIIAMPAPMTEKASREKSANLGEAAVTKLFTSARKSSCWSAAQLLSRMVNGVLL